MRGLADVGPAPRLDTRREQRKLDEAALASLLANLVLTGGGAAIGAGLGALGGPAGIIPGMTAGTAVGGALGGAAAPGVAQLVAGDAPRDIQRKEEEFIKQSDRQRLIQALIAGGF